MCLPAPVKSGNRQPERLLALQARLFGIAHLLPDELTRA